MKVANLVREGETAGFQWRAFVIERTDSFITGVYVAGYDRDAIIGDDIKGTVGNAMFEDHRAWVEELGNGTGHRPPRRDSQVLRDPATRERLRKDHTWMQRTDAPLHPWVVFTHFTS